jgi:hypothetical protein
MNVEKKIISSTLTLLLLVAFTLPLNPAHASSKIVSENTTLQKIKDISLTWLIDTPTYKQALVTVKLEEQTYEFLLNVSVIKNGSEMLFNVSTNLPGYGPVHVLCRSPDTLGGAPHTSICQTVETFHMHLTAKLVIALKVLLVGLTIALIVATAYLIYETIEAENLITKEMASFFATVSIAFLSIPFVLWTLLQDENPDGSVDIHFPYKYTSGSDYDYAWDLVNNFGIYAMATNTTWYTIEPRVYKILWWTIVWYEAHYYGTVVSPEKWCKGEIPPVQFRQYQPIASSAFYPPEPYEKQNITFISTSYAPNGTIVAVHWSFGDGYEAEGFNVTHLYERAGRYNVTITVTDNYGVTKTSWAIVDVLIPSTIEIRPEMINLGRRAGYIRAYIEFPEPYNVQYVNISSIMLNGTIPAIQEYGIVGDYDGDGITDLTVIFNRTQVINYIMSRNITLGSVELILTGTLLDGTPFMGSDVVIVRMPGDVNMDGKVDTKDISILCKAFGSYPGHPRWNSAADENEDGIIDIFDIALTCRNFGKTYS